MSICYKAADNTHPPSGYCQTDSAHPSCHSLQPVSMLCDYRSIMAEFASREFQTADSYRTHPAHAYAWLHNPPEER